MIGLNGFLILSPFILYCKCIPRHEEQKPNMIKETPDYNDLDDKSVPGQASNASSRDRQNHSSKQDSESPMIRDENPSTSPIVSHNEVSSSKQDPPDQSRSPSPAPPMTPPPSLTTEYHRTSSPPSSSPFLPLPLDRSRSEDVKPPKYSWHHPSISISAPPEVAPPLLTSSSVVPLLLPYPSLSHSVVYMNPFIPSPCQSSVAEKKKRNRTFIDPVTEVIKHENNCSLFKYYQYLNFELSYIYIM